MKKALLTKLMLLLCALIAGSSSVWADDTYAKVTNSSQVTVGSQIIFVCEGNNQAMTSASNFPGTDVTISNSTITLGSTSTVCVMTVGGSAGAYTFTYDTNKQLSWAKNGLSTNQTSDSKNLWTIAENGSFTCNVASTVTDASTRTTVRHNLTTGNNATNKFGCYTTSTGKVVCLYVKQSSAPVTKVATPSISGPQHFLTSTQVTIECTTDGAAIQYSTDNGANWSDYSTPFALNATTTVKAKATKSGLTDSDVSDAVTFTKVTPTTVAAALAAIDALSDNGTKADQCVSGIISQVDNYSSNAITYWISDDGTTTSQLEVYKGKGLNGVNFTAKTDLNVGDQVTVFGTLKKYVKNSTTTPEFDAGSQLLSYEATGTPTPAINASNVTIDSEATSGEITYTIDNPTAASLTAAVKSGDWISNVQVDGGNNKVTFTVTQNTGEQRIGYITLSYTDAADKDVKVTQKATYGTATLPFAFDSGKSDVATTAGFSPNNLGSDYSSSPKLKFDGEGDYLILKINGAAEVLNFDIKGNGTSTDAWAGTFKVQTSADGVTYTDLKTYTESILASDVLNESLDNVPSSARYIKWIYITKSKGNVALGRIGVNCDAITIPAAGYMTYCNATKALSFAGVTAYKVSNVGATSVTLEEITEAPANTPVILNATAGTYGLGIVASAAAVTGNELLVSDGTATTTDANTVYALASKGDPAVVGFYQVKAGTKVPAGKCYLSVAVTNPAPEFLDFNFSGETTEIADVRSKMEDVRGDFFDLQGRKVAQPTKGLYIVNGKKVVIK